MVDNEKADEARTKLGFLGAFGVSSEGRSGGLVIFGQLMLISDWSHTQNII